jgi:hypothetical protein
MTFLPVADRELRVRARQKATFRTRVGAALAACLIIGFFLVTSTWRLSPAAMGKSVFWFLSGLAFLWCLFEGPRNTADALSEEKREGTLGLLFLTDLKGYDVVLGKLLATSLNSFYGVLAIVPPLSIPLLLGGVTAGEFWRMVLLLLVTLVFSLSAGLLISANSRNERRAWAGAILLVGFLAIVPPLLRWLPLPSTALLSALSPTVGFYSLGDALFARNPRPYWYAIGGAHLLSWGFFVAACMVLPRSWQDKPVQRANRETSAVQAGRSRERDAVMNINPIVWMLTRGKQAQWYVWAMVVLFGFVFAALALVQKGPLLLFPFIASAVAVNGLLAISVAAKACFMIADARSSGALDLLLTTPLRPQQIIDGHVAALQRQFLRPFIALTIIEFVVVVLLLDFPREVVSSRDVVTSTNELISALLITIVAATVLCAQLFSCAWFGLWCGLTSRKPAQAVLKTILWVFVLPLLFSACTCFGAIVILIKDAVLISYASSQLSSQFRRFVTEGVPAKAGPWPRST